MKKFNSDFTQNMTSLIPLLDFGKFCKFEAVDQVSAVRLSGNQAQMLLQKLQLLQVHPCHDLEEECTEFKTHQNADILAWTDTWA